MAPWWSWRSTGPLDLKAGPLRHTFEQSADGFRRPNMQTYEEIIDAHIQEIKDVPINRDPGRVRPFQPIILTQNGRAALRNPPPAWGPDSAAATAFLRDTQVVLVDDETGYVGLSTIALHPRPLTKKAYQGAH